MNRAVVIDPAIGSLIVGCFAVLFLSAAIHKLRNLGRFEEIFAAYRFLPTSTRWQPAWLIPYFEIGVAVGLLLPCLRTAAAAAGAGLLLVYAIPIAINLRAGRNAIACGCGGLNERQPIASWMVWRNLLLAAVLAAAMLPRNGRALQWTDAATIGCGLTAMTLLYACAQRLLGELAWAREAGNGGAI